LVLVDAALHPDVRGRALVETFRSLRREMDGWEHADFSFGFASHPASLRLRGYQGKHDLGPSLRTYLRPLDLLRFARGERAPVAATGASRTRAQIEAAQGRRRKPTLVRILGWQGRRIRHRLQHRRLAISPQSAFELRTYDHFDDRIDAFFAEASSAFDFIQVRDAVFLNWRYADDRAGQFTIRVAESEGVTLGYLVLRAGPRTTDIADLLVLPGRVDVAHALIGDAVAAARTAGSSAIRSWMVSGHPYAELLSDHGFLRVRTTAQAVFDTNARTNAEELAFLGEPSTRVHLMLGDSDHV